jgi:hypothetical protein
VVCCPLRDESEELTWMAEYGEDAGDVEQVLILWEDQDPGTDEIVDLIGSVEPRLDPSDTRIEKSQPAAVDDS